jgi:preprotein translocase subunit SecG
MIRSSIAMLLLILMSVVSISDLAHSASNRSRKFMEQKGAKFVSKESELFSTTYVAKSLPITLVASKYARAREDLIAS